MKLNKKLLILIPVAIVAVVGSRFLTDRFSAMKFSGTVEATQVELSSRLNSNILAIEVKEGDLVKKDSILLNLDCEDINLTYERLLDDFERAKKLSNSGVAPKESFDKAKFLYKEVEIKKSWCTIRSPIDGVITNRFHEVGEYVMPGTKLLTVLDKNDYWVYFYVPQTLVNRFKVGDGVSTLLAETNETFEGKVIKINEIAEFTPKNVQTYDERARLVYGIKVRITNKDSRLKPGMSLDLEIEK